MDRRKCICRVRRACNAKKGSHSNSRLRKCRAKRNKDTRHNSRDQVCKLTKVLRILGQGSWLKNSERGKPLKPLVSHHDQSTRTLTQWAYQGRRANSRNNQVASLSNVQHRPTDTTIPRSPHQSRALMSLLMKSNSVLSI